MKNIFYKKSLKYGIFLTLVLTAFVIMPTNVIADDEPDFGISVFPSSQTVAPGEYTTFVITLTALNGFNSPVTLSISGLPEGAYAYFNPNPVTPTDNSVLYISASEDAEIGNFPITVTGTGGGKTHSIAGAITIDFGLIPMKFGTFTGTVTDIETNDPIEGAKVFIYSSYIYYIYPDHRGWYTQLPDVTTDSDGHYTMTGVPLDDNNAPLDWAVGFHADGYSGSYHVATAIADTVITVDMALCHAHITGKVFDADTLAPIANANIRGESKTIRSSAYVFSFTTDDQGLYTLPNLALGEDDADRTYKIKITSPEYCDLELETTISCGSTTTLDFPMVHKKYGTFEGRVTDMVTGDPIEGASVYIYDYQLFYIYPDHRYWYDVIEVTTDSDGYYIMNNVPLIPCNSPKDYVIGFDAEGYSGTYHPATAIADTVVTVNMEMCPENNIITGKVIDSVTNEPIAGVSIFAYSSIRTDNKAISYISLSNFKTDENGEYTLPNLPLGEDSAARTYSIRISHPDYYKHEEQTATISCGTSGSSDFSLIPMLYGSFTGRVLDEETDEPIEGATVFIYPRYHEYNKYPSHSEWYKTVEATTDSNGYYTMTNNVPLDPINLPKDYMIGFHADGYSSTYLGATAEANTLVTVDDIYLCHASITGKVIDAITGEPIAGADLYAWSYVGRYDPFYIYSQAWIRDFTTDDEGVYTLPNIPLGYNNEPREYNVRVTAEGYWPQIKTGTIFCGGTIVIDFAGPDIAFGTITGTVKDCLTDDPIAGASIYSTFGVITETDEDGTYTLTDIELGPGGSPKTGEVTAEAEGYESQTQSVEVNAEEPSILDFSLCPPIQLLYLTVNTDPPDLTTFEEEGWYDQGTGVELNAPSIEGYTFLYWDVDGTNEDYGVNPISVTMDSDHTATAHYFEWVTVSGHKYEDIDGTLPTTTPLEDWTINLEYNDETFSVKTGDGTWDTGYYEFTIKEPGTYGLKEELQEGWTQTYPEDGYTIIIDEEAAGTTITDQDFWNFEWFKIYGHKYFDGNGDGTWNNDEPYLDGWTINLDDTDSAITGDGTWDTGYYEFTIKEPGTYMVSEDTSAIWTKTEPAGDYHQVIAQSGVDVELNFGNWFEGGFLTDSSLCYFDADDADGQQFRLLFTPDIDNDPSLYKVTATNPGQFYYHVFYSGEDITDAFEITIADDFETQGATPVHVYSSLSAGPGGCIIPGDDISEDFNIVISGNLITVTPISEYDGFIYINVHCDYALKQTGGYELEYYYDEEGVIRGHAIKESASIIDMTDHSFSVTGPVGDTDTIQNRNEFKKFRGIIGFVTYEESGNPIPGVTVTISKDGEDIVELTTDGDGFYGWSYFHKGKPKTYTVTFYKESDPTIDDFVNVLLKAGHFEEVSYQVT